MNVIQLKKAKEFIININKNGYYPYILSGGDENEISAFINSKLSDFKFEEIHDQTNSKEFWIQKIIKENNLKEMRFYLSEIAKLMNKLQRLMV